MSNLVRTYRKAVVERRRLYLDYSCWLGDTETLTDTQVMISPYTAEAPIQVTTGYTDAEKKKLTMYVAGGTANINYVLSMVVHTNEGQVKRDDIGVRVTS